MEKAQKAVDRRKKLTEQQRSKREAGKETKRIETDDKKKRRFERQFDAIPGLIATDAKETQTERKRIEQKHKEAAEECETQRVEGTVTKPAITGRFKYKMRKEDFQLEDELTGSLRQLRSTGKNSMIREKFDDFFRRNLVEMDAPTEGEKKRQRKQRYKLKARRGGIYATEAQKLNKKNLKLKQANDEAENKQMMLQNDMIFI